MNYKKIYDRIIEKSRKENRVKLDKSNENYIYYENHHIIPRCLGGKDEKNNLVLLTAREHFISHKLLTYIYPNNYKIISAFNLMLFMNNRKYGITSRDYSYLKELYYFTPIDEETREKRKKIIHTKEWNKKISDKLKGHPVSNEIREKIRIVHLGRKCSEEQKEHYKRGNKCKNIGVVHSRESVERTAAKNRGIKRSNQFKKNVSVGAYNSRRECEYCHKKIPLNIYNRCHGKKCKLNEL